MKTRAIAGIMLTLILTSMLSTAFNVPPIMADADTAGVEDSYPMTQNANAGNPSIPTGSHSGSKNQNLSSEASEEGNSEPSAAEDKCDSNETEKRSDYQWSLNETNEWADFADVDGDSAELVIGVNNTKPNSYTEITYLVAEHGGELVNTVSMEGIVCAVVADIPLRAVSSFMTEMRATGLSRYVEPNMRFNATFVPDDPYWPWQWGPRKIEADYAWNTTFGDPSVLVAVIDTGIDWDHPDLASNYVPLGYDWVNDDPNPMDDHGHGTHCAGIIAAVINNIIGIAGLAQISIMAEKGLNYYGGGYEDDLANAIIHAVDEGADILSLSWGSYMESALIHEAIEYAYEAGVLVVASAGNDATNIKHYPSGHDEVIAVSATQEDDNPVWWTNFGDDIELAAPGVSIYSTVWDNSYTYMSGTSMSAPHVAGVAALVWSWFPNTTRDWVRLWLRYTADDLGDPGFDVYYGYGRVNARKAVEETPPDHDLLISNWERPPYVEPGMVATINTTVLNFGASNETDVTVQLLVNGSVVDSVLIGSLATGESATVSCSWSPIAEGMCNLTSFVVPVLNETITENNVVWAYLFVGFPVKAVVLQSAGNYYGDIISNWQVLNTNWYKFGNTMIYIDYTTLNIDDIGYEDIAATGADVLIISCAYDPWMGWQFTDSEIEAITRYLRAGHGLIATAGTLYYYVPNNNKLAPLFGLNETITWYTTGTDLLHIVNTTHPLFLNVPDPYCFPGLVTTLPFDGRWDENELAGGTYVALGHYKESAIVVYRGLVYISPWLEILPPYYHFHLQLLYNAITWSRFEKPEHELIVHVDAPPALKPANSTMLNATVYNMGLNNETAVELQLLVDGSPVDSVTIPELLVGSSYTLGYLWTPTVEGTYNVTAYAPPLLGEEFVENNVESASVLVYYMMIALFKNVDPWDIASNEEVLSLYRIPCIVFGSKDFGSVDLTPFPKVVIASDQDQTFYYAMDDYRWWFEDYVSNGGLLEIHATDWGWHGGHWVGALPGGLQWVSYYADHVTIVDPAHRVVTIPNSISDFELDYWSWSVHGYFTNYTVDSHIVIIEDYTGYPAYLEFQYGAGFILASSQTLEWAYMRRYSLILENSLLYCKFAHDLAVFLEAPAHVQPGDSTLLNVTIYNFGLSDEIDVELQILINDIIVGSVVIPSLVSGFNYTLSYLWTPTVEGRYNVTAYAPPISDREPTLNNVDSAMVFVHFVRYVLWDDVHDTDWDSLTGNYLYLYQLLSSSGFVVDELTTGTINSEQLAKYDILVLIDPELDFSSSEITDIHNWVAAGGSMFVIVDTGYPATLNTLIEPFGVQMTGLRSYYGTTTKIASHPITHNVGAIYYDLAWEIAVTSPSETLAWTMEDYAFLSAITIGKVVVISDSNAMDNWGLGMADNTQLMLNIFNWLIVFREHDLAVTLDAPPFVEPGDSSALNATVQNRGLNNETDVELFLLINGTGVCNVTIPELQAGGAYTLSYLWTPTVEATYNITAYAPPVPSEVFTVNNVASVNVIVRPIIAYVAVLDAVERPSYWAGGWNNDFQTLVDALIANGFYADAVTNEEIIAGTLNQFDVFVMVDNVPNDVAVPYVYDFWSNGGGIVAFDSSICFLCYAGILPPESAGSNGYYMYWDYGTGSTAKVSITHPVTEGYVVGQLISGQAGDAEYLVSALAGTTAYPYYTKLVEDVSISDHAYVSAYEPPSGGRTVHIWDQWHWSNHGLQRMILNAMAWTSPPRYEHDVAIVSVVPSAHTVLAGDTVDITVVAENQGTSTESFDVTAYASSTNSTRIYLEPLNYIFDASTTTVGTLFNVTVKVEDVDDMKCYQVVMYYNDTIINITRWYEPTWDPEYVFYGKTTSPTPYPPDVKYDHVGPHNGSAGVGCCLFPSPSPGNGFTGDGTVCIFTFNITAVPPEGKTYSCALDIDTPKTFWVKVGETWKRFYDTYTNGYYWLGLGAPPPQPQYIIGTQTVIDLAPGGNVTLTFSWDTTHVPPHGYIIWAEASVVPRETDTEDNTYTDDVVRVVKPPSAAFTYSPPSPRAGETLTFNATESTPNGGTIISYNWNFGDGNITTTIDPIITHVYAAGAYNVTLTITDSEGLTDSARKTIYVLRRDVSVVDVTPSTDQIYVGRTLSINVTVTNKGEATETFDVILYYNITAGDIIEAQTTTDLLPGEYRTLTFLWNTTGVKPCGNYTITAHAVPVPGETSIADNTLSSPTSVKVKLIGDINGDAAVDMLDVSLVIDAYLSYPGHPLWNPEADICDDDSVDILDISIVITHFGECL